MMTSSGIGMAAVRRIDFKVTPQSQAQLLSDSCADHISQCDVRLLGAMYSWEDWQAEVYNLCC